MLRLSTENFAKVNKGRVMKPSWKLTKLVNFETEGDLGFEKKPDFAKTNLFKFGDYSRWQSQQKTKISNKVNFNCYNWLKYPLMRTFSNINQEKMDPNAERRNNQPKIEVPTGKNLPCAVDLIIDSR